MICKNVLIGKNRDQVIERLGDNYISDLDGYILTYEIKKTWFCRKKALIIEFDDDDKVISVDRVV